MGFEVSFKYHEKRTQGGYDTENVKEFKKDIGKATDDVPLEKLAKVILAQLARRDIWVIDVEIYEYSKKKVSFNETKGGVVIKHKKFNLDHGEITSEDVIDVTPPQPVQHVVQMQHTTQIVPVKPQVNGKPPAALIDKPIRYEYYDPQFPELVQAAKKRGYKFTLGKKYPIYEEKPDPRGVIAGMIYHTEDDNGQRQVLNALHFQPEVKPLERGFEPEEDLLATRQSPVSEGDWGVKIPEIKTFRS